MLLPISHVAIMPKEMMGIPGNNPVNFIWLLAFVLVYTQSGIRQNPFSSYFRPAFIFFIIAYTIAALWTAIDISSLHPTLISQKVTAVGFLISNLLKQFQIIITGLMVYKYCCMNGYKQVENAVSLIPMVLLPFVLYYFYKGSSGGEDYGIGRQLLSINIGMNANEIGGLAVAILAYNLGKIKQQFSKLDLLSIAATLLVIVFSLSRMAFIATLVIFLLSFRSFTFKQKLTATSLLLIVVIAFTPLLLARINFGVADKQGNSSNKKALNTNELSAGRIDWIWKPSLSMIADKPILGDGLYSIWKGQYIVPIKIMKPAHPHNAYLQLALDMGIVGFGILVSFLLSMWKVAKHNLGFKYAFITWLLMGLTGSTFYPEIFTLPIWLYYAISCAKPRDKIKVTMQ